MSQNLRLTLRTLLAYLDDTLEPAQARAIGQKVAESESARDLIERIKLVTHRRRLTTPTATGPGGKIDPNTVAEYLDNEVTAEQAAEVEQICLASDVHLAEVAACHQMLTLILGEPLRPPASSSQRMYGLIKGPEALAHRKAPAAKLHAAPEPDAESRYIDETLRLGLPALGRSGGWRNPLILVGGGFLAALILVVAIFQILHLPTKKETDAKAETVAQTEGPKDKSKTDKTDPVQEKEDGKVSQTKGPDNKESSTDSGMGRKNGEKSVPEPAAEPLSAVEAPFGPPNPRQASIGTYVADAKDAGILLQASSDAKLEWKRVTLKHPEVSSARPLMSLPGSRSVVETSRGVRLTLWGNMPEYVAALPIYESMLELYSHDVLDLDVLLQRGRVVLTSTRAEKPVHVRLRFENPLVPSDKDLIMRQEYFDIKLQTKGSSLLVDRWSYFPLTEPFFKDPKNPKRKGPTADMGFLVLEGTVLLKTGDATYTMTAPPGSASMTWNSFIGPKGPFELAKRPDIALDNPPLPKGTDPNARKDLARAVGYLSAQLANSDNKVDVALANALKSPDPSTRRLVVRSLAAVSDLSGLLEALDQPNLPDLRLVAIDALRYWISTSRDNDYKLLGQLKEKYKNKEAEIIMEMMHEFSEAEWRRPGLYEILIDYLVNPNLVIRELAAYRLYSLVPAGRNIPYSAAADSLVRERAEAMWRALIPAGQLPPTVTPTSKKK